MSKHPLSYKWIMIGGAIIFHLNLLMRALLADPVQTKLLAAVPGLGGILLFTGIVAFVSFFVGGGIIGYYSPGETIKEPAIAAMIAAELNCIENFHNVDGVKFTVTGWMIGSAISIGLGFVMALGGAWVGEKIQGPTRVKLHEDDDQPPSDVAKER